MRTRAASMMQDTLSLPATGSNLERWLRSPLRRRACIALGVLIMAAGSTLLWVEAFRSAEFPREFSVDWVRIFERRLLDWGLWGLALEPIAWVAVTLARWVRHWAPLLILHAGLSIGVAQLVDEADSRLSATLFERPEWAGRRGFRQGTRTGTGTDTSTSTRTRTSTDTGTGTGVEGAQNRGPSPESQRRARDRFSGRSRFRRPFVRETGILMYWMLLGLGWGARSFLQQRDQERRGAGLELRAARLEAELSGAKLARLQSQLHPHFLFNALHSVGGLVRSGEEESALSTLSAIGGLLRATLEHEGAQEVTLAEELSLSESYLDIERIRFGDRLQTVTHVEPGLGNATVPALVLLPLLENAVQHGIAPRSEGGRLELDIRRDGRSLCMTVSDDGPGFAEEVLGGDEAARAPGDRPHIGLVNTRSRLAMLYGEAGTLTLLNPTGGGARVVVHVPLEQPRDGGRDG